MAAAEHDMHEDEASYEKVSASLGSLLLLWARIEKSIRDELERRYDGCIPKSAFLISGAFKAWKDAMQAEQARGALIGRLALALHEQLQAPLAVRNGLCHGLRGVTSSGGGRHPALTWELNGECRSASYQELQRSFQWLSKVPYAISAISSMNSDELGTRVIDTPENRNWWRSEYGLIIPQPAPASAPTKE